MARDKDGLSRAKNTNLIKSQLAKISGKEHTEQSADARKYEMATQHKKMSDEKKRTKEIHRGGLILSGR